MSDGMNRVILLGNLGADPELRFTGGGQAVLNIRLATNKSWLDKDKVKRERTDWHNVVVWGARAEGLAKILTKGSTILVEGELRTSDFEKDGQKHYRTDVHALDVILAGGNRGGGEGASESRSDSGQRSGGGARKRKAAAPAQTGGDYGEDLPC